MPEPNSGQDQGNTEARGSKLLPVLLTEPRGSVEKPILRATFTPLGKAGPFLRFRSRLQLCTIGRFFPAHESSLGKTSSFFIFEAGFRLCKIDPFFPRPKSFVGKSLPILASPNQASDQLTSDDFSPQQAGYSCPWHCNPRRIGYYS
jgi:hypothetical protein